MEEAPKNKLWTRNFTIITLGSVVSLCGNALTGFAMSLLVLDYTGSSLLYATFVAVYTLPQIFMPVLSGALLDRFSRRKTIYTLDFFSAGLYASAAVLLHFNLFTFPVLTVFTFIVGSVNSIYAVAYQSFYPLLISEGNFSKAYSIASVLETLAALVVPVSALVYNSIGIAPLMALNVLFFLTAAIAETQIDAEEKYIRVQAENDTAALPPIQRMTSDIREGIRYLWADKGLLCITLYFFFCSFGSASDAVITLPYFKRTFPNGEYYYMLVIGTSLVARGLGGLYHYRHRVRASKKYAIALFVYVILSLLQGSYLYFPIPVMVGMMFICGLMSVTSYTFRVSATQSYVPDEKKARFNGAFALITTIGTFTGEMAAGALAEAIPQRAVVAIFMLINGLAALFFIGRNGDSIRPIYNRAQ